MARKPIPGSDEGQWGEILNKYLDVAHAADGSLRNDSIVESKLAPGVRSKLNSGGGGAPADGSITTAKLADGAVNNSKIAADAAISQSKVAGLGAALDGKAATAHTHSIANVTNLQAALDGKAAADHTHPTPSLALGDLTNVNTSGATAGQVLTWQGSQWAAASQTGGEGGGVTDHGALTGLDDDDHPHYLNNARGDARYYTRGQVDTALEAKANTSHNHNAADINSGVLSPARLGSGTADGTKILYGDGAWKDAPTGGGGGVTNLGATTTATNVTVTSSTGTNATLAGASTSNAGVLTAADKTKLDGVATGATANATDAQLRDRANHTGAQAITTVTGLQTALDAKANSNATVNLSGNQAVEGVKTFSSSPVVPTPTANNQAANKAYVDSVASGGGGGGAPSLNVATVTEEHHAVAGQWVIGNAIDGGFDVRLPEPTAGAWIKVKKLDNTVNSVLVWPPSGQINAGSMTSNTISVNVYGMSYDFWADGSQWHLA